MSHPWSPTWIRRLAIPLSLAVAFAAHQARAQDEEEEEEGAPAAHAPAPEKAAPAPAATPTPAPAPEAKPKAGEAPSSKPSGGWTTPPPAAPAAPKPSEEGEEEKVPAAPPKPAPAEAPGPQAGYLEGRAESTSPNELVHTVEKKTYTAAGEFEATLYPAAIQLNSKFTNTDGIAVAVSYAIQENMALQLMGFYNYVAGETAFNEELLNLHARPEAADALTLDYGAAAAFEVAPIYGKFAFYQGALAQFRFVLNAGAGFGHSNVQLTNGPDAADPTAPAAQFGDTGFRFLGNLGVGFRILIGSSVAIRLEVRDLLYTARVDHINGCTLDDVTDLQNGTAPADSGCNLKSFNPNSATALTVAKDLLGDVSSDVVNDVVFFGGASILF